MATEIFNDTFTEASDTALADHTPGPTGTAWAEISNNSGETIDVIAASDVVKASGDAAGKVTFHTCTPVPSVADYDVECTITVNAGGDDLKGISARHDNLGQFSGTYYFATVVGNAQVLGKNVAGTKSQLGTSSTTFANGDKIKLEVRTDNQEYFADTGAGFVSLINKQNDDSDDGLDEIGRAGYGMGASFDDATADVHSANEMDDFIVTEQGGAPPSINLVMAPYTPT